MELSEYQKMIELQKDHWWFSAKHKILSSLLKKRITLPSKILEVGAGTGANLPFLKKFGPITALEPHPFAFHYLSQNFDIKVIQDSLPTNRKEGLEDFDLIVALDVIEHIDDDMAALRFIYERLRPGGLTLITVPAFSFLWSSHDELLHHKRRYKRKELIEKMKKIGLQIEFQSYFNFLLSPLAFAIRLMDYLYKGVGRTGNKKAPALVNGLLKIIFGLEAFLLPFLRFPFGLSIVAIGKKESS